jgi:hypothetical protein
VVTRKRAARFRDLLGHASITTTERYDNQKIENLQVAAGKLESGKSSSDTNASMTRTKFQDSIKKRRKSPRSDQQKGGGETEPNAESENDLQDWLGGRDSNPDTVVQSLWKSLRRHERTAIFRTDLDRISTPWPAMHICGTGFSPSLSSAAVWTRFAARLYT